MNMMLNVQYEKPLYVFWMVGLIVWVCFEVFWEYKELAVHVSAFLRQDQWNWIHSLQHFLPKNAPLPVA